MFKFLNKVYFAQFSELRLYDVLYNMKPTNMAYRARQTPRELAMIPTEDFFEYTSLNLKSICSVIPDTQATIANAKITPPK